MKDSRRLVSLVLAVVGLGAMEVSMRGIARAGEGDAKRWFELTHQEFAATESARRVLDFEALDQDLLSAAVFHETNRRREKNQLSLFKHDAKAREAAAMQARVMARERFVGHVNPVVESLREFEDRLRVAGLKPKFAAENVAMTFGWQYEAGKPFFVEEQSGRKVYRYAEGDRPIQKHSYLSFAESLLDHWMNSPGHRANILDAKLQYLGCSAVLSANDGGMESFYCAQVFMTPLQDLGSRDGGAGSTGEPSPAKPPTATRQPGP